MVLSSRDDDYSKEGEVMPHKKGHKEGLMPQEKENLFNVAEFGGLADTEFMVEAGRFGKTDPMTQLGLDWWWDTKGKRTQIFDTGQSFDPSERGGKGWTHRGVAYNKGTLPEGVENTADMWAQYAGYRDGKHWFDSAAKAGKLRPEVVKKGFDEWEKDMLKLGENYALVMYSQAVNPLQPETWTHELGHIGQEIIREGGLDLDKIEVPWWKDRLPKNPFKGSTLEAKQRVRDIMMSSPGQESYKNAHEWLQTSRKDDKGNLDPYTDKEIRNIAEQVLLEDKLSNLKLESRWGVTLPSGSLSQYEEEYMPGVWDKLRKRMSGLIDTWDMGLFD